MAEQLHGKVAIATGGNTGIGSAVVLALAEQGSKVLIDHVANEQAEEELERKIANLGEVAVGVEADVSKIEDLQRMIDTAVSNFGRLDIMVNNAGIETRTSVLDTTEAQFEKVMAVNLKSAFFGTQLLSKGGIRMLTRTAGVDLAPHNICLVGVGPGAVNTPINAQRVNDPAALAKLNGAIPMGRMAEPEEIASVVAFLAGDGAGYITATTIFADGGIMQSSPGL